MTLAEANRFMIVCALIRDAALRAEQYLRAVRSQRYVEGTDILNEDSFETLVKAFLDAKAQGLTECELLTIPIREVSHRNMADQLKSILRQTDYLGIQGEKELQILLPNTNKEGAEIVRKRLQTIGISVMEEGGFDAS